jgi:hypothetical protein
VGCEDRPKGSGGPEQGHLAPGEIEEVVEGFVLCNSPPACADGVLNQDETDVDCGGECGPCAAGSACSVPDDC